VPNQPQKAPLRHIVVLCHPEQNSFNASVATAYSHAVRDHGHEVIVRDLYAMGFHPVLKSAERPGVDGGHFKDVEDELEIIRGTDVFVLVYPIWFGSAPAMLKGYVERVLGSGVTPVQVQGRSAHGALAGKRMLSFTSSGLTEIWLDEQGQLKSLVQGFDRYIEHAFSMLPSRHVHFGSISAGMTLRSVDQHLEDVRGHARDMVRALEEERSAAALAAEAQS